MSSLRRDTGFYLFTFADETGVLFEVHANDILEAEDKLRDILGLSDEDPRRELHWRNWTPSQAGDPFKYGNFRKVVIGPRAEPDPFIRPVQK